ncbi:MAG: hypothetical protein E6K19_03470 [Methanobacteriota archaeon]|nr:MAG: hypothetical protein E6K19_03470 [Euryarchaeota archaeon]
MGSHGLTTPTSPLRRRKKALKTTSDERRLSNATKFLVIWWMSKTPYAAVFTNRVAAEAAANVRNALLVTFNGPRTNVEAVVDWYRRDDDGQPMPAEWRELMGHMHAPWRARPAVGADGVQTDLTASTDSVEA